MFWHSSECETEVWWKLSPRLPMSMTHAVCIYVLTNTQNIHWEPPNTDTINLYRSVQQKHNFPFYSNRGKWLASKIHKTTVWQAHFWRRWLHIELPKSIVRSILGAVGVMDVTGCGLSAGALQVTEEQEASLLQMHNADTGAEMALRWTHTQGHLREETKKKKKKKTLREHHSAS